MPLRYSVSKRKTHEKYTNVLLGWQKASFFECLLDMAGQLGGSRAGSLSHEGAPLMAGQDQDQQPEESSLASLARRSTKRNRSTR